MAKKLISAQDVRKNRKLLRERLEVIEAQECGITTTDNSEAIESFIVAAATRDTFHPEELAQSIGVKYTGTIENQVSQFASSRGQRGYRLNAIAKNAAIKKLLENKDLDSRLAELIDSSDVSQKVLGQLLKFGNETKFDEFSVADLHAAIRHAKDLSEIIDVDVDLVRTILERKTFLEIHQKVIGGKFAGRAAELNMLDHYIRHGFLSDSKNRSYRPLLIRGPGGMGKSTLLAYYLLNRICDSQPPKIPFAFLDFDRRVLSIEYPATLLNDALRQLAFFFPDHREAFLSLRNSWRDRLRIESGGFSRGFSKGFEKSVAFSSARATDDFIYEFGRTLHDTGTVSYTHLTLPTKA